MPGYIPSYSLDTIPCNFARAPAFHDADEDESGPAAAADPHHPAHSHSPPPLDFDPHLPQQLPGSRRRRRNVGGGGAVHMDDGEDGGMSAWMSDGRRSRSRSRNRAFHDGMDDAEMKEEKHWDDDDGDSSSSSHPSLPLRFQNYPYPSRSLKPFYKYEWLDVLDTQNTWLEAQILDGETDTSTSAREEELRNGESRNRIHGASSSAAAASAAGAVASSPSSAIAAPVTSTSPSVSPSRSSVKRIFIHYKGYKSKYDEWLNVSGEDDDSMKDLSRLAPLHAHTTPPQRFPRSWPRPWLFCAERAREFEREVGSEPVVAVDPFDGVGARIDTLDAISKWERGIIIQLDHEHGLAKVHYENWNENYDEWINIESYRLQPRGSFTNVIQPISRGNVAAIPPRAAHHHPPQHRGPPIRRHLARAIQAHLDAKGGATGTGLTREQLAKYQATLENELRFRSLLRTKLNFTIIDQAEDGNCLFRSVSHQIYGDPNSHPLVREACMNYIQHERYFFENFIAGETFEEYVTRMRMDGEWGDNVEIQAMSEIYDRPIEIYAYSHIPLKTFTSSAPSSSASTSSSPSHSTPSLAHASTLPFRPIRLSYHFASHYNSIVGPDFVQGCLRTRPGAVEEEAMSKVRERRRLMEQLRAEARAASSSSSSSILNPEIPPSLTASRATFRSSQDRLNSDPLAFEDAVRASLSEMDRMYQESLERAQEASLREHEEAMMVEASMRMSEEEEALRQQMEQARRESAAAAAGTAAAASATAASSSAATASTASPPLSIEDQTLKRAIAESLAASGGGSGGDGTGLSEEEELQRALQLSVTANQTAAHAASSASSSTSTSATSDPDAELRKALAASLSESAEQLPPAVKRCVDLGFPLEQCITAFSVVGEEALMAGLSEEATVERMMEFLLAAR